jgi:hypothetical protein
MNPAADAIGRFNPFVGARGRALRTRSCAVTQAPSPSLAFVAHRRRALGAGQALAVPA